MATSKSQPRFSRPLVGKSILMVEDEPLVALGVHEALSSAGASVLSAATVLEAIDLIGFADISAAIVDVDLGGPNSGDVCHLLMRRRIPFGFYTGHVLSPLIREWAEVPMLAKPAGPEAIVSALASVVANRT